MISLKLVLFRTLGLAFAAVLQANSDGVQLLQKRSNEEVNLATLTYGNILLRAPSCSYGNSTMCLNHVINETISSFFQDSPNPTSGSSISTIDHTYVAFFSWITFDNAAQAFEAFDNTTERLAILVNVVTDFVMQNRSSELCLDLYGSGGLLNHGMMTISVDGEFEWPKQKLIDERLQPPWADCGLGNMYVNGNNVLIKEL